jgi:methylamine dehydrogenase accessory protein MauD
MIQALIIANLLLWACVIAMALVVFALVRQVGLLHERVTPVGALMPVGGPAIGDEAPQLVLEDLSGRTIHLAGAEATRSTLLFFLSPTCPVCKTLLPILLSAAGDEAPAPRIVLASDGELSEHESFIARHGLGHLPYVLSAQVGIAFGVGKLPYAILIDEFGVLRAKGIVNTREHLESLFEAQRRGVASIQDYLAAEGEAA